MRSAPKRPDVLRVDLLGGFDARWQSGAPASFRTRKVEALLVYLAMEPGHRQPREKLAALLWGESAEEEARQSLRQALSDLRHGMARAGSRALTADHATVALEPQVLAVDAVELIRLAAGSASASWEQAVALYRGPFLDGFDVHAEAFEEWATRERQRLNQLVEGLLLKLLTSYEGAGAAEEAVRVATRLLEFDELREDIHRRLIRLYAQTGRRAQALKQYEQCRQALRRELGVEPEAETQRLATAIRRELDPPEQHRLAVLPFVDLSQHAGEEYFVDGLTEEIIATLSRIEGLRVIARSSVMTYKGARADVPEIGRRLRVATVLEGSVRRSGARVRVTAQLIDVATLEHLWAESYDRGLGDVLALQRDVAASVSAALKRHRRLRMEADDRPARSGTENPAAYVAYLRGRHLWSARTRDSMLKSIEYFASALAQDPNYALAQVGLADAYALLGWFLLLPPSEMHPKARAAAEQAIALDPGLGEAHAVLGVVKLRYEHDAAGAEAAFRKAIALTPSYVHAHHWYGIHLQAFGRFPEALTAMERALALDPLSMVLNANLGWLLGLAGRHEQALAQIEQTMNLYPDSWYPLAVLGRIHVNAGRAAEGAEAMERGLALSDRAGNPWHYHGIRGALYANAGRRGEALAILEKLRARAEREYVPATPFAEIYICLPDERDSAFAWLQKTVEQHESLMQFFKVYPLLDPLRSDPRFGALLKQAGLV